MGSQGFHVCVVLSLALFAPVSVRADACPAETIAKCTEGADLGSFSQAASVDLIVKLCGRVTCLTSLQCDLPDSMQGFDVGLMKMCSNKNEDGNGTCSIQTVMGCMGGLDLTSLSADSMTDPETISRICGMGSCMDGLTCQLPQTMQGMKEMTGRLCSNGDGDETGTCSIQTVMGCMGGLDLTSLSADSMTDPETISRICGMDSCIDGLQCQLPHEMQSMKEMTGSVCSNGDGDETGVCSIMTVMECVGDFDMTSLSADSMKDPKIISQVCGIHKCLQSLACQLPQGIQSAKDNAIMTSAFCADGSDATSEPDSDPGMGVSLHPSTSVIFCLFLAMAACLF